MQQLHLFQKRGRPKTIRPPEPSETQIHIAVMDHIRYRGRKDAVAWHTPNGGSRDKREAAKLKAMGTTAGIPDILILMNGKLHCLELKAAKGRTSGAQDITITRMAKAGAVTAVAHGLDAALSILTTWGVIPGQRMARAA